MRIYNYLFYKSYQMAVRSRNFDDMPVLGALGFVGLCLMFNLFTIALVLEGFEVIKLTLEKEYKFPFALALVLLLLLYYLFNGRYRIIIKKYEKREQEKGIGLHPILIIITYYGISTGLMFLAALFKNGDWIFSK